MTICWTSDDCDGQVDLKLHLSVGQVILFPYFDHCMTMTYVILYDVLMDTISNTPNVYFLCIQCFVNQQFIAFFLYICIIILSSQPLYFIVIAKLAAIAKTVRMSIAGHITSITANDSCTSGCADSGCA